jgi:mercuric ion transport protein
MTDRTVMHAGIISVVLAAICCAAPLLVVSLPLAGLGAWFAGADLIVLPLIIACFGLIASIIHRRHAKAACGETTIQKQSARP